jgi:peroxiredoxin
MQIKANRLWLALLSTAIALTVQAQNQITRAVNLNAYAADTLPGNGVVNGNAYRTQLQQLNTYLANARQQQDSNLLRMQEKAFMVMHPDYYVSLLLFRNKLLLGKVQKADKQFELFPASLRGSALGKEVALLINAQGPAVGQIAPEITAQTPEGVTYGLSQLRGKYVFVDFWASWCAPCRAELPYIRKAYQRFQQQNFTILSVSLDASKENWLQAVQQDSLTWINICDLKGWNSPVVKDYFITGIPQSYLLGPDGKIIALNLRRQQLEAALEKLFL